MDNAKSVLITGASGGIGLAIAEAVVLAGCGDSPSGILADRSCDIHLYLDTRITMGVASLLVCRMACRGAVDGLCLGTATAVLVSDDSLCSLLP